MSALSSHKWRGRLCNRIHTGILVTTMVFVSNSRNHGVMNMPVNPWSHGPSFIILSLASDEENFTMKNPLEHRCISQFSDHLVKIQWNRSIGFGHKQLKRQIISCDSREAQCSSAFELSMLSFGMEFSSSKFYRLGGVPTYFFGSIAVLFPCRIFLKEGHPFICFSLTSMFPEVLHP